jgi:hypothetical protein
MRNARTRGSRRFAGGILASAETVNLLVKALVRYRMVWLFPLVAALLLCASILALLASVGPLAPFVYPLF